MSKWIARFADWQAGLAGDLLPGPIALPVVLLTTPIVIALILWWIVGWKTGAIGFVIALIVWGIVCVNRILSVAE